MRTPRTRSHSEIETAHRKRVASILARATLTLTDTRWDALVNDWNHLSDRQRRAFSQVCGREGHIDVMTTTGRWLCARCLRYQPSTED